MKAAYSEDIELQCKRTGWKLSGERKCVLYYFKIKKRKSEILKNSAVHALDTQNNYGKEMVKNCEELFNSDASTSTNVPNIDK